MKAPGIHCYVAGSIPAVTPRYCTKKIENALMSTKKTKEKKSILNYTLMEDVDNFAKAGLRGIIYDIAYKSRKAKCSISLDIFLHRSIENSREGRKNI